ncbi:ribosome hibernation-promoting factor, HPF/YfiA family [Fusobacterium massiliense]|jgi:ribosomal subunit interface protein|uniref:ribosome hibernation-promoting factor, HPF/YfiA family n=1 Tax=Fusobacterium massiliense TaxID=1852365 RepID=UPI00093FC53F|nr:ribosome-associated translation inhibitor RaiA [Fusobacterium massiliense]
MKLSIYGRKITLTEAIKKYAQEKISRVEKFNDSIIKIDATLTASKLKTGNTHITEILAYLSGTTIKVSSKETDLYASIDKAIDILETQLKKHKEKHSRAKLQDNSMKKTYSFDYIADEEEKNSDEKKLVKVFLPIKPMEISEALLQLEALNKVFFAFTNVETGKMTVVYKRKDGDYGVIEE